MRRRRQQLQVSTFPFLAVLLCAMGALIFLLLVIDRRAKVVARARAQEKLAQRRDEVQRRARERQAAVEEQKRQRLALLDEEKRELEQRLANLLAELASSTESLQQQENQAKAVAQHLHQEQTGLLARAQELASARTQLGSREKLTDQAREEVQRQAAELRQLEAALAALRVLRQREQQTYSVVPYRGKRGDNRQPLYIECTRTAIVFHPDRLSLEGLALNETRVRQEVTTRMVQQKERLPREGQKDARAYLLLLLRPDGIQNYYGLLASVAGMPVDFGYELVDADWILDFNEDGDRQPWQKAIVAQGVIEPSPPIAKLRPSQMGSVPPRAWNIRGPVVSYGHGTGGSGYGPQAGGPLGAIAAFLPGGGYGQGPGVSRNAGMGGDGNPSALAPFPPNGGYGPPGRGGARAADSSVGRTGPPGTGPGSPGTGPTGGVPGQNGDLRWQPSTGAGPPGNPDKAKPIFAVDGLPGRPGGQGNQRGPGQGVPGGSSGGSAPPGSAPGQGSENTGLASGQRPEGGPASGPAGQPHPMGPGQSASAGSPGGSAPPGSGVNQAPPYPELFPGQRPGGGTANPSGQGQGSPGEGGSGQGQPPSLLAVPGKGPPPTPIGRLLGNRDWIIALECKEKELFLRNTGQRFPLATAADRQAVEQTLVGIVRDMVARRQATVRQGEPPYRPMLRLLVHGDGQRAYYLAYPLLQPLGLPMTRENVYPDSPLISAR